MYQDRLKRDYNKYPLQYGELPIYEDIYFLYIECNLTKEEVAKYLNIKPCSVGAKLKKLGITKPIELKVKCVKRKTKEKYGDESYTRLQECKDKMAQTNLKRYGVTVPAKSLGVQKKMAQTNLERYGFESPNKSKLVKEKINKTCQEKYGCDWVTQTEHFKQKVQETNLKKHEKRFASQSDIFKETVRNTNLKNFGIHYATVSDIVLQKRKETYLQKWSTDNISTKHIDPTVLKILNDKDALLTFVQSFDVINLKEIANIMGISYDGLNKKLHELELWDKIEHKVSFVEKELQNLYPTFHKTRQIIAPYEIDLYNDNLKLGIEFNGLYWHSEVFKDKHYHQHKSKLANAQNVFIFHIFEHEWLDDRKRPIIKSMLDNLMRVNTTKIMARKCTIQELDAITSKQFLNDNHLQGGDNASIRYGLFYENTLVSVMTFCKPRFNKNYEWELTRFCTKCGCTVQGGASKLFKHFIKEHNPSSIISYSNYSKTKGTLYKTLGFNFINLSAPNYIWFKGYTILSRYQCQKHKLDQTKGSTEDEIMHNDGYLKLYDCGNGVWEWKS